MLLSGADGVQRFSQKALRISLDSAAAELLALYVPNPGTAAVDVPVGGFTATLTNGATVVDQALSRERGAASLDGTDDYVASSATGIYVNATTRTFAGVANRDTNTGADCLLGASAATVSPYIAINNTRAVLFEPAGVAALSWAAAWPGEAQRVAWAIEFNETTNNAILYINGTAVSTQATTQQYNATPGTVQIGRWGTSAAESFDGLIGSVAIFSGALTAAEHTWLAA